jgi:hypothetical protein
MGPRERDEGKSQPVFGRGRHKREIEEAAREADRRALFAELAKRPDTVCPFLGLAQARAEYHDGVTDEHRCYAFGDPAELSAEQQHKVCLQRGYGNCPRYLRGVLVIPTAELEALRRPQPAPPVPPPQRPAPAPAPAPAGGGSGRRGLVAVLLVLLLAAGGGGAAFVLLGNGLVASETPTPLPSATVSGSVEPSAEPTASGTAQATPTPEPTPAPADVFDFYEVVVDPRVEYTLFEVDDATGALIGSRPAEFDNFSQARVEPLDRADGSGRHWRTREGDYLGLSYIHDPDGPFDSGPFRIRAVYRTPDGGRSAEYLPEDEL